MTDLLIKVSPEMVTQYIKLFEDNCQRCVGPSLVAFYINNDKGKVEQIGSGFAVNWYGRALIISAYHVLTNLPASCEKGDRDRTIMLNGALTAIKDASPENIYRDINHEYDIFAFFADGFPLEKCLPLSVFPKTEEAKIVTIYGYLARDFRRNKRTGELKPKPQMYTNIRSDEEPGKIALSYSNKHNKSTNDPSQRQRTPIPAGLSGGPMIDSLAAGKNDIRIIGVFTDRDTDTTHAHGEPLDVIHALLEQIPIPETPTS